MPVATATLERPRVTPPSDDKRWRIVEATMRRHGYQPHALIETLHTVQETFGYIDEDAMRFVAQSLRVPLSQVYGVVTFYHFFTLKPQGEHICVVCLGTACYIKGAPQILEAIERTYGIKPGETTKDGKLSLLAARCLGACGLAPVAVFDGQGDETMAQRIVIDPVTRIEGHAKITIQLDEDGNVADAWFHVTQLQGFEKLWRGDLSVRCRP